MKPPRHTAGAILRVDGTFVLQHRDDRELLWRVHHDNSERGYDVHASVFTADVTAEWPTHVLTEGQGLGLF